jgi:hypothetical protein
VAHLASRSQPPEEPAREPGEEDAEVVDLTKQRLLGWVRGMFGGKDRKPSSDRDR